MVALWLALRDRPLRSLCPLGLAVSRRRNHAGRTGPQLADLLAALAARARSRAGPAPARLEHGLFRARPGGDALAVRRVPQRLARRLGDWPPLPGPRDPVSTRAAGRLARSLVDPHANAASA